MEPKKTEDKKKKPAKPTKPTLPTLTEFYLDLIESAPGSLSLEKIEEVTKEAERLINQGLRNGKTFEEIKDLRKGHRTTERYEAALLQACERYSNLSDVREAFQCSSDFLYRALYKELEKECREKINYPWPYELGIDEHSFRKNRATTLLTKK